ncbi:MAG: transcriptional repressor LexA [Pseudomonadota bacterium]|nr:transcriptional repressor LexA [Pseudomonadota bacterium]
MLTNKQLSLLEFICKSTNNNGVSPSFDEMKEALGLKSKSGIHRLITALEERGFIRRLPHRARALEVIKKPPDSYFGTKQKNKEDSIRINNSTHYSLELDSYKVPLIGNIAAGLPIDAIEEISTHVSIPNSMIGVGKHFALEVKGESMIGEGINHGDIVVIKQQNIANNGDIVVALVEDQEATLKKLKQKGDTVELEAANPNFKTQKFHSDQVKIQGRLVGLLRRY